MLHYSNSNIHPRSRLGFLEGGTRLAFSFEDFIFDPYEHRLSRDGEDIQLRPKTFEMLRYLIEKRQTVVSKEELLSHIWADTIVVESVVPHSISELRNVLGDSVRSPRFLRTVPKIGYQFIAEVAQWGASKEESPETSHLPSSIAVMAFSCLSPDADMDFFCEGLAEEIISELARLKHLRVAARSASFAFKGRNLDPRETGQLLGVETILEGSLRICGTRFRVGAQLINIDDGFHLWSGQFHCEMGDVFAIQDEIAERIVEHLKSGPLGKNHPGSVRRGTDSVEAYLLNLRARYLMMRERQQEVTRAIHYFERAVKVDPGYVDPHCGLTLCYASLGFWNIMPPHDAYRRARASVQRALEIDPESDAANALLAFLAMISDWDWETADRASLRAVELNPFSEIAWGFRMAYYLAKNEMEEAEYCARRAVQLEPLSNFSNCFLSWCLLRGPKVEEAVAQLQKTVEIEPMDPRSRLFLGKAYVMHGDFEKGLAEIRKAFRDSGENLLVLGGLGWALARAGRREDAMEVIERLIVRFRTEPPRPYAVAKVYAGLGDLDEAFTYLEEAYNAGDTSLAFIQSDESVACLRDDPRFARLLGRMGL